MRFKSIAEQAAELDRAGCERAGRVRAARHARLRAPQTERREHAREHRRLELRTRVAHEERDLSRRFAAAAAHRHARHVARVSLVEPADAIVGETGARADRAGPSFVADHAQREIVTLAFVEVALVTDMHGSASWLCCALLRAGSLHAI